MDSKSASEKLEKQLLQVRSQKIERLKTRIASGKYKIDNAKIAKALFVAK